MIICTILVLVGFCEVWLGMAGNGGEWVKMVGNGGD